MAAEPWRRTIALCRNYHRCGAAFYRRYASADLADLCALRVRPTDCPGELTRPGPACCRRRQCRALK